MTNKDKVIAAFLVSMGLFQVASARQYVQSLTGKEKTTMLMVVSNSSSNVCSTDSSPQQEGKMARLPA